MWIVKLKDVFSHHACSALDEVECVKWNTRGINEVYSQKEMHDYVWHQWQMRYLDHTGHWR